MTEDEEIAAFLDSYESQKAPTATNEDDELMKFVIEYEKNKELEKISSAKPTDVGSFVTDIGNAPSKEDIEKQFLESRKQDTNPIGGMIYKYAQGMTGGLIDPVLAKIAQTQENTKDIPAELYQKVLEQNVSEPLGGYGTIAEIAGALNPMGVFAKTGSAFGAGKSVLGKLFKSMGNEALQQGGLRTVKKMIEKDGQLTEQDIPDIAMQAGLGGAFGLGSSAVGQLVGAGANQFRKTQLGEKTAKLVGDLYDKVVGGKKIDVDQIDSSISKIKETASQSYKTNVAPLLNNQPATTVNSVNSINKILSDAGVVKDGNVVDKKTLNEIMRNQTSEFKEVLKKALSLRDRLIGESTIPIKNIDELDKAKQGLFDAIGKYSKSGAKNPKVKFYADDLYNAIKKDVVESVSATNTPEQANKLIQGWTEYHDSMKQIDDVYSVISKKVTSGTDVDLQKSIIKNIGQPEKINALIKGGVSKDEITNTLLDNIIKKSKDLDENFDIRKIKRDILDNSKTWQTLGVDQQMKELANNLDQATIQKISKVALPTRDKATALAELQKQGLLGFGKQKAQEVGLKAIEKSLYAADNPKFKSALTNAIRLMLQKEGNL